MLILVILLNLIKESMSKIFIIKNKIKKFNKQIQVSGDKSLSIRWVLLASQAVGKSKGYNLLMSEDVLAAIDTIKKLGIKVKIQKNYCEIVGNGINGFKYKENLTIDAKRIHLILKLLSPLTCICLLNFFTLFLIMSIFDIL